MTWNRETDLVVLDELHKMRKWKSYLKGLYDSEGVHPPVSSPGARASISRRRWGTPSRGDTSRFGSIR